MIFKLSKGKGYDFLQALKKQDKIFIGSMKIKA